MWMVVFRLPPKDDVLHTCGAAMKPAIETGLWVPAERFNAMRTSYVISNLRLEWKTRCRHVEQKTAQHPAVLLFAEVLCTPTKKTYQVVRIWHSYHTKCTKNT